MRDKYVEQAPASHGRPHRDQVTEGDLDNRGAHPSRRWSANLSEQFIRPMNWHLLFINPQRQMLRSGWRVVIFFAILIPLFAMFGGLTVFILSGSDEATARQMLITDPFAATLHNLSLILAALIASAICLRAFDHAPLRSIGYQLHTGWWRDYIMGAGLAAVMMSVTVGIQWSAGWLSLQWAALSVNEALYSLTVSLLFFNLAGAFEELVCRGYPLQTMLRDTHPAWGVLATSTIFSLAHAANPHVSPLGLFNTMLAGVWLAVAYLKTRSLWLCTGLHWSWNWTMSAIYGLHVSGLQGIVRGSLLTSEQNGPAWLTGGAYGPEGGLIVTGVIVAFTVLVWRARWLTAAHSQKEHRHK